MVLEIEGSPSAAILMKALWPIGVAFPFVKPDQMPPFHHDVGAEFPAHPETEVIAYNCASRGRAAAGTCRACRNPLKT